MLIRILLCEDEALMVEVLKRFLGPVSSFIASTGDLEEAVKLAENGNFHLVILDLRLIKTDKIDSLHAIRKLKEHGAAVIVCSGLRTPNIEQEAREAGADAFVSKDVENFSKRLLLAVAICVMHLPREAFKDQSFTDHVKLLQSMANT